MARPLRTRFAAPLIVVLGAAGCGDSSRPPETARPTPLTPADATEGSVTQQPPPPPVDAAQVATARRRFAVQRGRAGECWAQDDPCSRMQRKPDDPIPPCNPPSPVKIACPPTDVIAIVELADGTCQTQSQTACDPGVKCNPPAPRPIACP